MCGACGRAVIADPTLGPVRTRRDMLVVAQVMNVFTKAMPGRMVVRVAGDAWAISGSTGVTLSLDTVEQMWEALLHEVVDTPDQTSILEHELARQLHTASPLVERVLQKGLAVARARRVAAER